MIENISQINTRTEEGKLLLAAVAKITTESQTDKTPEEVLDQLRELSDEMDFKEGLITCEGCQEVELPRDQMQQDDASLDLCPACFKEVQDDPEGTAGA